jgi:elongation factor 2
VIGSIYNLLNKRRGIVISDEKIEGTLLNNLKAYLPVNESTGFNGELRGATSGKAFPQCSFHHWQLLPGDPLDLTTKAGQICQEIRKAKNLRVDLPNLNDFLDKL